MLGAGWAKGPSPVLRGRGRQLSSLLTLRSEEGFPRVIWEIYSLSVEDIPCLLHVDR
jgi:hypothetical protein